MKPEYIGINNFDENNYVYAYCKCPLSSDYAIKWPRIKDGKPHRYTCVCEDCGTEVAVVSKSYGPEVVSTERDGEYEVKVEVVSRGNCMLCGKPLTEGEGIFFCKECGCKIKYENDKRKKELENRLNASIQNMIDQEMQKKPSFYWKCERCGKIISYMADFCHECADEILKDPPKPFEPTESDEVIFNNLCDSCSNIGCEFQSGIIRKKCAFYMPPRIEPDNCGNYIVK